MVGWVELRVGFDGRGRFDVMRWKGISFDLTPSRRVWL